MRTRQPADQRMDPYVSRTGGTMARSPSERLEPTRPPARPRRRKDAREPRRASPVVRFLNGLLTFVLLLMLLLVGWLKDFVTSPLALTAVSAVSVFEHFDDFTKGVLDTKHIAYYVSVITFGLFLTARSVDGERWRG